MLTIERENDFVLTWDSVDLATDHSFLLSGTVTMTLKVTSTGAAVSGASALTMAYVSNSRGKFQGRIPASALPSSLALGSIYTIEVSAVDGSYTGFAKLPAELVERTS